MNQWPKPVVYNLSSVAYCFPAAPSTSEKKKKQVSGAKALAPGLSQVSGLFQVVMHPSPGQFLIVVEINDIDFRTLEVFQQDAFREGSTSSSADIDLLENCGTASM